MVAQVPLSLPKSSVFRHYNGSNTHAMNLKAMASAYNVTESSQRGVVMAN